MPSDTHAFVGETFILECSADSSALSYRWEKDNQPIATSERVTVVPGVGLTVTDAVREDGGVYVCVVEGEEGEANASARVNVTGPLLSCDGELTVDVWLCIANG